MGQIKLYDEEIARRIALTLLKTGAVKIHQRKPVELPRLGWLSPVSCNIKRLFSFVKYREVIFKEFDSLFTKVIQTSDKKLGKIIITGISIGLDTTSVDPISEVMAIRFHLPHIPVGQKQTDEGRVPMVEGATELLENASLILIDGLLSTGRTTLGAIRAIEKFAPIKEVLILFDYSFKKAERAFANEKFDVHVLCDLPTLLKVACEEEYITLAESNVINEWHLNPEKWSFEQRKKIINNI